VLLSLLVVVSPVSSYPLYISRHERRANTSASGTDFVTQNGLDAQNQNQLFTSMNSTDPCQGTSSLIFILIDCA
jgi:hypothetical protein